MSNNMNVLAVKKAQKAFPTGDPKFCVMQPFPAAFTAEESDPFLMCDRFGPVTSTQTVSDPDHFPVAWHPHRGMDICTYLTEGISRHADSLGNRGTFASPGLQVPTNPSPALCCSHQLPPPL
jgi:redox-sensitive bicupin YhaK (pirin superfamily)